MPVRLKASLKVQRTRLQYAAWLGNTTSLIIVVDNDIYLKQSPSDEDDIRITTTGQPDLIYNGVPDWLYQGNKLGCLHFRFNCFHYERMFGPPFINIWFTAISTRQTCISLKPPQREFNVYVGTRRKRGEGPREGGVTIKI